MLSEDTVIHASPALTPRSTIRVSAITGGA
jgi:hypothetical protein